MGKIVYKPDGKVLGLQVGKTIFEFNNLTDAKFFQKVVKKQNRPLHLMKAIFQKYNGIKRFKEEYRKYPLIGLTKTNSGIVKVVFYSVDRDGKPVEKYRM